MVRKTVDIWVIRHGERKKGEDGKSLDELSPKGLLQLAASVNTHLPGLPIDAAYCSDMQRTKQTAEYIAEYIEPDLHPIVVQPHPAFFVRRHFEGVASGVLDRVESVIGERGTAADWLKFYHEAQSIADNRLAAFCEIAEELTQANPKIDRVLNVLVADHFPFANLGALDPEHMGPVGLADIIKNTMQLHKAGWIPIRSVHLRCPLV